MNGNKFIVNLWLFIGISSITVASENQYTACKMDYRNIAAVEYVGTRPTGGIVQLQLLQLEGLQKNQYVLEIGCGALMSGIPIMSYLDTGHYVGIDPNTWLREQTVLIAENQEIVAKKGLFFSLTLILMRVRREFFLITFLLTQL